MVRKKIKKLGVTPKNWRKRGVFITLVLMLTPLGNRVLCRPVLTEETLPDGRIILMEARREALTDQQAEVISASASCDPRLTEGTWVLHKPMKRVKVEDGDEAFWLLEDDIVAILDL